MPAPFEYRGSPACYWTGIYVFKLVHTPPTGVNSKLKNIIIVVEKAERKLDLFHMYNKHLKTIVIVQVNIFFACIFLYFP